MEKEVQDVLDSMREKAEKERPYKLKLRNWLNGIFMVLALVMIVLYFTPIPYKTIVIFTIGCVAVMAKVTEVMIRMTRKFSKR